MTGALFLSSGAALPPAHMVASQSGDAFGRIEGSVVISTALVARRPRFRIYTDPGPGSIPPSDERTDSIAELKNVVVYLGPEGSGRMLASSPDPEHAVMSQKDEIFRPHILPVTRGSVVDFRNDDDVYHNVFSLSRTRTFDLGRYPKGSSRSVTFNNTGRVDVYCHIHSDMSSVVLVLDNPFFTTPEPTGRFVIEGVPPGDYTIVGWHQRIKPVKQRIHVVAGQTTRTVFTIPLRSQE
jgi:plastocyanin